MSKNSKVFLSEKDMPRQWYNLAADESLADTRKQLAGYIPANPIDLPEVSLIELDEHHVPPFRSKEYFFSKERQDWMKRFN